MAAEQDFLDDIERSMRDASWHGALLKILAKLNADSGTIHTLGQDGVLHLQAATCQQVQQAPGNRLRIRLRLDCAKGDAWRRTHGNQPR